MSTVFFFFLVKTLELYVMVHIMASEIISPVTHYTHSSRLSNKFDKRKFGDHFITSVQVLKAVAHIMFLPFLKIW